MSVIAIIATVSTVRTIPISKFVVKKSRRNFHDAYGIPIISSYKTRDNTLKRACYVVRFMMADREDLRFLSRPLDPSGVQTRALAPVAVW